MPGVYDTIDLGFNYQELRKLLALFKLRNLKNLIKKR